MGHMTQAVYTCYKKLQAYAKSQMDFIQHTYIITDGSGQQFKNRFQFMNLSCHKEDFGSYASWIFTATAHGKNECDGLGGSLKRLARDFSLRWVRSQMLLNSTTL